MHVCIATLLRENMCVCVEPGHPIDWVCFKIRRDGGQKLIIVTMWLLFMSLCARYAVAAPAADRVAELPDYGTPPTPQYSGFLKAVVFLLMPMIKISRPPIFYLLHWLYHFHDFEILLFIIISVCWHLILSDLFLFVVVWLATLFVTESRNALTLLVCGDKQPEGG